MHNLIVTRFDNRVAKRILKIDTLAILLGDYGRIYDMIQYSTVKLAKVVKY